MIFSLIYHINDFIIKKTQKTSHAKLTFYIVFSTKNSPTSLLPIDRVHIELPHVLYYFVT